MYQYKFTDDTAKAIADKIENNALVSKLKNVDSKYAFSYNNDATSNDRQLNLQKTTYVPKTESEINSEAELSLSSFKDKALKEIDSDYQNKKNNLEGKKSTAIQSAKQNQNGIAGELDENIENIKNKTNRQGISRSSISQNLMQNANENALEQIKQIDDELSQKISSYQDEIDSLEAQKQSALESFDIEYAVKLADKINSIKSKEQNLETKVINQNNSVESKLATNQRLVNAENLDEQNAYNEWRNNYIYMLDKYGEEGILNMANTEKLGVAKQYFENMSRQDAINDLTKNEDTYKNLLGNKFNDLVSYIVSK